MANGKSTLTDRYPNSKHGTNKITAMPLAL